MHMIVKALSASGGQELCPWTPLGAKPPDPYYRLALPRPPCFPPFSSFWIRRCLNFDFNSGHIHPG